MGLTEVGADDRGLWDRVRHDDSAAFAVLYGRHVDAVYNYCFRRTGSWATAEDLTSVVFLETWRRREHIDLLNHSMLPFLLGTASNVVYKQTRSLIRHRRAVARLPRTVEPDPANRVVDWVDAEARMRAVLVSVSSLSRAEQDVIALCIWQGVSYADAAIALRVPVGTVRSRLARARAHLREIHGLAHGTPPSEEPR